MRDTAICFLKNLVILSEAKDLLSRALRRQRVLRFAQNDKTFITLALLLAADRLRVPVEHREQGLAALPSRTSTIRCVNNILTRLPKNEAPSS